MIKKTINHLLKFKYPYALTIMGVLAIHSFVLLSTSGQILWFGVFMIEAGYLVFLAIEYEKEAKNKANDNEYKQ